MVGYACNPSTHEIEAGGLRVQSQPGLISEFQISLGYIARLYLKKFFLIEKKFTY
jgi:hypothetical protein